MHRVEQKTPKKGAIIKVSVYENDSEEKCTVYLGSVYNSNAKAFLLGGLYEETTPLKGCDDCGRFVPLGQEYVRFPRSNVAARLQKWQHVRDSPSTVGQYFVYVDNIPVPMTIISTKQLAQRATAQENLMCAIGGTHSFYATDFDDVRMKLGVGQLRAFSEYTDGIYKDMAALISGSFHRRFLRTVSDHLHKAVEG